jgi:acetyl esterase/lipase
VKTPELDIPISEYLSERAAAQFIERMTKPRPARDFSPGESIQETIDRYRLAMDEKFYAPRLAAARARWKVTVESAVLGGVKVDVIEPTSSVSAVNQKRILINLHGGGFCVGEGRGGLIESIPISGTLGIRVISIRYRQGPEYVFPAASEDVATVYRELLGQYDPGHIGLYGCSDGGLLTAMTIARLLEEKVSVPGAIALICSPAGPIEGGDSRYVAAILDPASGDSPPPLALISPPYPRAYLNAADLTSALVSPMDHPDILRHFPSTLLISATRAIDCSSVIQTYRLLTRAGVQAQLELWDGLWHGFVYDVDLPEAISAFQVMGKFFDCRLGSHGS